MRATGQDVANADSTDGAATIHRGIPAARDILLHTMVRFPKEATISFNLACYAAQSVDLEDAQDCLRRAFTLNSGMRQRALDDLDLAPVWASLGQL